MFKKILLFSFVVLFLGTAGTAKAHLPRIIYNNSGDVEVKDVETSQAFYDELGGNHRNYLISSNSDFNLYINLLVPQASNPNGRYSAKVFFVNNGVDEEIAFIDGQTDFKWVSFYEPFGRDYYLKGPEFEKKVSSGQYKIIVFSYENRGKYVLAIGKEEKFSIIETLNVYWQLPLLKLEFFKTSVFEFFLTPFGLVLLGILGFVLILFACGIFIAYINESIKQRRPQMLLLTSSGMRGTKEEILSIIPKPADKVRVANIITAGNLKEDKSYIEQETTLLKEVGFNVEDIDIVGKNEKELFELLSPFDIVYVQGGNTFYLLDQMRRTGFVKIIKKLLHKGIVYVGVSAGSIVAGKTIKTASWAGDENVVNLKDLKGLGLVKFDLLVHYNSERAEVINQKSKREKKDIRIITDEQAIFVYGKKITLVGEGKAVIAN